MNVPIIDMWVVDDIQLINSSLSLPFFAPLSVLFLTNSIHSDKKYRFPVIRLKCGEFLLLLIGHVDGRERPPLAAIHEDIRRLLGEKSASLIWAASQFGSTVDPKERLTALQIQAGRVLESLDLY